MWGASKEEYLYDAVGDDSPRASNDVPRSRRRLNGTLPVWIALTFGTLCVLWLFSLALMYQYAVSRVERATRLCGQKLYSPAQDAIEYEVRVFSMAKPDDHTDYYGPPNELNNKLWRELWSLGGGQGLTREEASHLTNRTSTMAPNNPDLYYTDLDVVHQLHCLDHIRHAMTNDTHYLHSASLLGEGHVWHCFEALRESLMCHSDISTIVRQWDPKLKEMKIRGDVAHTCRNFWKIHQWGKERALSPDGWDDGVNHDADDLEIDGLKIQEV